MTAPPSPPDEDGDGRPAEGSGSDRPRSGGRKSTGRKQAPRKASRKKASRKKASGKKAAAKASSAKQDGDTSSGNSGARSDTQVGKAKRSRKASASKSSRRKAKAGTGEADAPKGGSRSASTRKQAAGRGSGRGRKGRGGTTKQAARKERPADELDVPRDAGAESAKPKTKQPSVKASLAGSGGLAGPVLGGPRKKKGGRPGRKAKSTPAPEGPRETFRGLTLNDFQMQALGPLREGRPVLLAAPTGAGKTLVAELAIQMSLDKGKRAIYTAPIKALSNQKYRDFKAIDPDGVGIMTGDVTINPQAPVLIMTTEILRNTILENPASLDDVETVVFDEIHYMDDPDRGTVWEESIIFAPPQVRFVCLSATIANLDQFGQWIGQTRQEDVAVIRHVERPVPLAHYAWFPGAGLRGLKSPVRFPKDHVAAMRRKGGGGRGRGRRGQGGRGRHAETDKNVIIEMIQRRGDLPMLFFCFSRKECERRALDTARRWTLLEPEGTERIEGMFDETCRTFEIEPSAELEELRSLVRRGIAYHHAGMLPLHKELVERLFTSALLQVLFCTETFSLGINMPAHTVVFSSLRKFDGSGFSGLKVREYQQMAGRAGRQGIDDEGVVVSLIDDHRVLPGDLDRLIGNDVEPVVSRFNLSYSTLINLHRSLGERLHEAWERSFNNFQWARMSAKKRAKNEAKQREAIDRRLELLEERGYITPDGVTEKGRIAATINGFELQVVELLDSGLLDWMDEIQIAITFAAIGFEERKNDLFRRLPGSVMGTHRKDVEEIVGSLVEHERRLGIAAHVKAPSFKIGVVVRAWCLGASFEEIREDTTAPFGDLVRQMRLTVQLLRQLRAALPKTSKLVKNLDRARMLLNRDEVDAARQLGLG